MPTFLQRRFPIINEFQQHILTIIPVSVGGYSRVKYLLQKAAHPVENDFSRTFDIDGRMLTGL